MDREHFFCGKAARAYLFFYRPFISACSFFKKKKKKPVGDSPKILLCCLASLGDVLLAASVIPALRKRFPKGEIGFLCTPSSSSILEVIEGISYIHTVPSFKGINIGRFKSFFLLLYHSIFVYPKTCKKIKEVQYDVSLELHLFFSSTVSLARRGGIPNRIGFLTGGCEFLLTDPISLPKKVDYLPVLFEELLKALDVSPVEEKLYCFTESNTIIFHLGTSDPRKEWKANQWNSLAKAFKEKGFSLVFTGSGKRDRELIKEAGLEDFGKSLVDELSFAELALNLKNAKLLISVDSVPIHLAAFLKVPFVALYLYSEGVDLWLPDFSYSRLLVQKNCLFINGEPPMKAICLEKIKWEDVFSHGTHLISEL
jgi:heptosyltransferase I